MNNNFLLTYNFENCEGAFNSDYRWFENETEMRKGIEVLKDAYKGFEANETFEIINAREIEL